MLANDEVVSEQIPRGFRFADKPFAPSTHKKAIGMIVTCPATETLRDFASGKLSEVQCDEVSDHIRDCQQCQGQLAEVDRLEDTFAGQLRDSTVNESFQEESECRLAMAKALSVLAEPDASATDNLPSSIGEYDIVRQLGRGGMGSVYLAQHTKLNRKVAIKVLAANRLSDPRMHARFTKEMRAIGSMAHPNIVTAHDARDVGGVSLLVTEWVDGLDLREILHRLGPLSVEDACAIVGDVADALSYVEAQGLIHRDIKPSNVMINRQGDVKLLDLGLARLLSDEEENREATATGQALGTADYASPEQINDARAVDIRADIYGLGCTLFKLLVGRAPFEDADHPTAYAKMTAHVSQSPPPIRSLLPQVPAPLAKLIQRMLAKSPDDRPASPKEVASVLAPYANNSNLAALIDRAIHADPNRLATAAAQSQQTSLQQPLWKRRVPVAVAVAAGLGGLLIGLLAGITLTIRHPDGSQTTIHLPDNTSDVDVDPQGNVGIQLVDPPGRTSVPNLRQSDQGSAKSAPVTNDTSRFSGIWEVVNLMDNGKSMETDEGEIVFVFHETNFVIFDDQRVADMGALSIDSKTQSLKFIELEGDKDTQHAIYRFHSDNDLEICMNEGNSDQVPTRFESSTSPSSPNQVLLRLRSVALPDDPTSTLQFIREPQNAPFIQPLEMYQKWLAGGEEEKEAMLTAVSDVAKQRQSMNNLKQLGVAFHQYHNTHHRLPASAAERMNSEKQGKKVEPHSWRVAILPFIDQDALYQQYRFDEPWDSEHNSKLLDKMPEIYRKPGAAKDSTSTSYVGIVGEGTMIGATVGSRFREFTDGLSNTMLVAGADTEIPWTKPQDFLLDDLPELSCFGEGRLLMLLGDGSVQTLKPLDEKEIRLFAIGNDGKYKKVQP